MLRETTTDNIQEYHNIALEDSQISCSERCFSPRDQENSKMPLLKLYQVNNEKFLWNFTLAHSLQCLCSKGMWLF